MLLVVNIGNRQTTIGVFDGSDLLFSGKISTLHKTSDEFAIMIKNIIELNGRKTDDVDGIILSSVVPQTTSTVKDALTRLFNKCITEIAPGIKTGFSIKIDDPSQLGSDIVANTSAAISKVGYPCIIIDIGNSTTIFAVNTKKELVGGCILPGIDACFESLYSSTAQLPNITRKAPVKAIGKNTADSMRSGVILGTAMAIDGFVDRFTKELSLDKAPVAVATGEGGEGILNSCRSRIIYDKDLTIKGLSNIMSQNSKR